MRGIDTARYQGVIDWNRVKASGIPFAIQKCTEGTTYKDPSFERNKKGAREAGVLFGSYHFAGGLNPQKEAEFFVASVGDIREGELLALDYEINLKDPVAWCKAFLDRVTQLVGFRPMLYTNEARVKAYNWKPLVDANYGLWVAKYSSNTPATGAWPFYALWQYSSNGSVNGITGRVDMNTTSMDLATLKKYGKPKSSTPAPEPERKISLPIDRIFITQEFGENPQIYKQFGLNGHNGMDFRTRFLTAPEPTPLGRREIFATMDGKVIEVKNEGSKGYGLYVRIEHRGNEQTIYGHLTKAYVQVGTLVKAGSVIALSGNTGFSSGPHLHYGWRPENWNPSNGFAGYEDPRKLFGKLLT